ncbi:hypothetical protein SAMN05518846_11342 [Brevibacillus centrosporus]|uniref:Uncharacterized protein n=1 Tax=Brevibacillus centrosporus TaxID=54910 RepID=A0A1I3ZEC6_9BACL|nr:hypothetical protein SAMN05518846_11342 [Brevibacillus centrosporus]
MMLNIQIIKGAWRKIVLGQDIQGILQSLAALLTSHGVLIVQTLHPFSAMLPENKGSFVLLRTKKEAHPQPPSSISHI